ncbi:hypothetical protein WISP_09734 [Willisornis vidua]|uniref:Uncharacterized protein n=1 Tax=Willisornis vidua TaxID=1566151 RepID=A0ABQ9DXD2_9PASS|nr:hypothetical protein WISP_09734 [Willisornis vidua]
MSKQCLVGKNPSGDSELESTIPKSPYQVPLDGILSFRMSGKGSSLLGVKWQDLHHQIPTEIVNKIIVMAPLTSKKEMQAFLGAIGFRRMYIPEYNQIMSPLYLVTHKRNDFHWGPKQQ